jgi:hypothetical protein
MLIFQNPQFAISEHLPQADKLLSLRFQQAGQAPQVGHWKNAATHFFSKVNSAQQEKIKIILLRVPMLDASQALLDRSPNGPRSQKWKPWVAVSPSVVPQSQASAKFWRRLMTLFRWRAMQICQP